MTEKRNINEMVEEQLDLQVERGKPFNFYDAAKEIIERNGLTDDRASDIFFRLTAAAQRRGWMFSKVKSEKME